MSEDRRLCGFILTGKLLSEFVLSGYHSFVVSSPVPPTARFYKAEFDWKRNCFIVYFEDESFYEVAEGEVIPIQPGPVLTYVNPGESDSKWSPTDCALLPP